MKISQAKSTLIITMA